MTTKSPATDIIRMERLGHAYGRRPVLEDLGLEIRRGEFFGLLGPNGGGKTTLFRILATLLRPQSGAVWVGGWHTVDQAAGVREIIGVVFQSPSVDRQLTVKENLSLQGAMYGLRGNPLRERVAASLRRLGLEDRKHDRVSRLSGGLQRRLEIAKALLHEPPVLLLDEPTVGLDPAIRAEFWETLLSLRTDTGMTVVFTTHLLDEAERCDRVAILDRGRWVAIGKPSELSAEVGGDVILVEADEPESLRDLIGSRWGVPARTVDGRLMVERRDGHAFIPQIVEAFPGRIRSISMRRPTLEDVFVRRTGHAFRMGGDV